MNSIQVNESDDEISKIASRHFPFPNIPNPCRKFQEIYTIQNSFNTIRHMVPHSLLK